MQLKPKKNTSMQATPPQKNTQINKIIDDYQNIIVSLGWYKKNTKRHESETKIWNHYGNICGVFFKATIQKDYID